jgi:hypothetical protein
MTFRQIENLTKKLDGLRIENDRDFEAFEKKVFNAIASTKALWANEAIAAEAAELRSRLQAAWHKAAY